MCRKCPPSQVYAQQQQHGTALHVNVHSPAEGADIAARMAAASVPAPVPPQLPYCAFAAAPPPVSRAASLMDRRCSAAEGSAGLPLVSAYTGSMQAPSRAAGSAHPGGATGCAVDVASPDPNPPRTPSAAAHACELAGPSAAECTPQPGGDRAASGSKEAGSGHPDGRHSPDAVLAWADAWSPPPSTAAVAGTGQKGSDRALVDGEAWRERLTGALAGGLSSGSSAAAGAGLGDRLTVATHITAFSGAWVACTGLLAQ